METKNHMLLIGFFCATILISYVESGRITRMLHGKTGKTKDYPFIASLQVSLNDDMIKLKFCGGAILNARWIVTAAHCFDDEQGTSFKTNYKVSVGGVDALYDGYPTQIVPIELIIMHPRYNSLYENDIAMTKLEKDLDLSGEYVKPIALPPPDYIADGNATILGWGQIDHKEKKSTRILKVAHTSISPNAICVAYYGHEITNKQICVGYGSKYMACAGDSGSPLVQKYNGEFIIVGVTSYGFSGCREEWPMVYTKVASHLNFIERAMREF